MLQRGTYNSISKICTELSVFANTMRYSGPPPQVNGISVMGHKHNDVVGMIRDSSHVTITLARRSAQNGTRGEGGGREGEGGGVWQGGNECASAYVSLCFSSQVPRRRAWK